MDNIKNFLEKLKPGFQLTDSCAFLKKYDKDNNSIFDADEVEQIKKDLTEAANSDANTEQLSDNEILSFFTKLFGKSSDINSDKLIADAKSWIDSLIPYKDKVLQKVKQLDSYKNLSDIKKQYIDLLISIQERPEVNDITVVIETLSKDENNGGYSDEYVLSNKNILKEFAKLKDFEFSPQNVLNILELNQLPEGRIDRVNESFKYISSENAIKLSGLDEKVFSRMEESIANTPRMLEFDEAIDFVESLDDADYKKAKPFLSIENRNKQLKLNQILTILHSGDAKYSKALAIAENNNLSGNQIIDLMNLDDEKYSQAVELLELSKQRSEEISGFDVIKLAQTDAENFEKVKRLVLTKINDNSGFDLYLSSSEIVALAKLDDDKLNNAIALFNIQGRTTTERLSGEIIAKLVEIDKNLLNRFISENPNFIVRNYSTTTGNITLEPERGSNKQLVYNKDSGLVETSEKSDIRYDENGEIVGYKKSVKNIANGITQESYYEKPEGYSSPVLVKDTIKELDNSGNVILVTNIDKSSVNGVFNITITDSNGNTKPVQYAYKDEEGKVVVYKSIPSPDGSKIEYHYEKSQDNKSLSSYVIKDKNGTVLFERNQTNEVLSESPYRVIASVNGKVYEVKFDGKKIFITDKSNNKQEEIDLNNVIEKDGEEVILELLKKVPPQQLLMMKKFPILKMKYEKDNLLLQESANWQNVPRSLTIGERSYAKDDQELFMVFVHEYGHYLDTNVRTNELNNVSDNSELNEIYQEELKNFASTSTASQQEMISYFTDFSRADDERVAESNAIINNGIFDDVFAGRQYYLQKYFPKTIAKIAQLISEMENSPIKPKD